MTNNKLTGDELAVLISKMEASFRGCIGHRYTEAADEYARMINALSELQERRKADKKPRMPPHKFNECVNNLTEDARTFAETQMLRARMSYVLSKYIEPDHPHTSVKE